MAFLSSLFGGHDDKSGGSKWGGGDKWDGGHDNNWGGGHDNKWGGYEHEESYKSGSFDLDLGLSYEKESYHKESDGKWGGKWGSSEESYESKSFDLDLGLSKSFESYHESTEFGH